MVTLLNISIWAAGNRQWGQPYKEFRKSPTRVYKFIENSTEEANERETDSSLSIQRDKPTHIPEIIVRERELRRERTGECILVIITAIVG